MVGPSARISYEQYLALESRGDGKHEFVKDAVVNPTLIVEVTSTEADDRGAKFGHYRQLASLQEYVIVSGAAAHVEVWRRNDRGRWELADEAGPGGTVQLASIDARLDLIGLYANPLALPG